MFRSVVHCILLVHVIFTRLYIFEYKFNMGILILVSS